jgi:hypothetical protein
MEFRKRSIAPTAISVFIVLEFVVVPLLSLPGYVVVTAWVC